MKNILLLAFLSVGIMTYSQTKTKEERQKELEKKKAYAKYEPRDSLNYKTKYCLLLATGKMFTKEVDIRIDYGQDASHFEDTSIRDKNGKKIIFNSVMDALNYMESIGWEFVDAYAASTGSQSVYHYLMKSTSDNPEDFIPKTKRDFQKQKPD